MNDLSDNTKLVRLATITTFIHSLLFIVYLIYILFTINQKNTWSSGIRDLLWEYIDLVAPNTETVIILIVVWIGLLIWYAILPPIGDASMIYYLDSEKRSGTASLWKWVVKFFPMFEFNATMTFFNILAVAIALSRFYVMGIINGLTIIILVLRSIFSLIAMFFLPYTKFIITLEDSPYFEAMRKSTALAINNLGITFRFIVINFILYARFIINILIVVGIPLLLLWGASTMDMADNKIFQIFVVTIVILLVALTAYINGIIEAFFITYWWKVYKQIRKSE